jgi:hypothetical protein
MTRYLRQTGLTGGYLHSRVDLQSGIHHSLGTSLHYFFSVLSPYPSTDSIERYGHARLIAEEAATSY